MPTEVDESTFFREATIRICGHLAIEHALRDALSYIERFVPVDAIYLETLEPRLGSVRAVARATSSEAEALDLLIPLPPELNRELSSRNRKILDVGRPPVRICNQPRDDPPTRALLEVMGFSLDHSILGLSLVFDKGVAGNVIFLVAGTERYGPEHARLLALLREPFHVAMNNALRHREVVRLRDRLLDQNRFLHRELSRKKGERIVGAEFGLRGVMEMVDQVALLDSPVLILGETGVGKDLVARAIHRRSERRAGPFVAVNCGALPATLIDSELFGHEKGAFTGAFERKLGRIERASGGTIFLDEVGELPASAQVMLLRVLQSHELERVGGKETVSVDIRVISATHRDLGEMVRTGKFREDLWFRLNVFPIPIPPLRARRDDIPALVDHFTAQKAKELKWRVAPTLAEGSLPALRAYDWPGNVRELENVVERAMILQRDQPLRFAPSIGKRGDARSPSAQPRVLQTLEQVEVDHIRTVLRHCRGKIEGTGGAAQILGLHASTLRSRMKKLGLPFGAETYR